MYCKNCGKVIDSDSKFCNFCGTKQNINANFNNETKGTQPESSQESDFESTVQKEQKLDSKTQYIRSGKLPNRDILVEISKTPLYTAIALIIIGIIIYFNLDPNIEVNYEHVLAWGVVARILIALYVGDLAMNRNRNGFTWGLFAFFLPIISLITIYFTSRKIYPNSYNRLPSLRASALAVYASKLFDANEFNLALDYANESLRLNDQQYSLLVIRARILCDFGDFRKALADIERVLQNDLSNSFNYYLRGKIYLNLGNPKQALQDWEIAITNGLDHTLIEEIEVLKTTHSL